MFTYITKREIIDDIILNHAKRFTKTFTKENMTKHNRPVKC